MTSKGRMIACHLGFLLLLVLLFAIPMSSGIAQEPETTPGPVSSFQLGDEVKITIEGGVLLLYSEADFDAQILEALINGVTVTIVDGPIDAEGVVWWEVKSPSGINGWTPESIDDRRVLTSPDSASVEPEAPPLAGAEALAIHTESGVLLVYSEPSADANAQEALINGVLVTTLEGPISEGGETWWKIRSPSGLEGWVLASLGGQPTLVSPLSPTAIAPSPTPILANTSVEVTVNAAQRRNDTGLSIITGQLVTIEYVDGSWRAGPLPTWPFVGPDGDPQTPGKSSFPVPEANIMSLVAGIGTNSYAIYIGQSRTFESPASGMLWLGANDDGFADNVGSMTVRITVSQTETSASSTESVVLTNACPSALPSRIALNGGGAIEGGDRQIYSQPGAGNPAVATLLETAPVLIVGGPECADNQTWWQIKTTNNQGGWIPEGDQSVYFIKPCPVAAVPDYGLNCPNTAPSRLRNGQAQMRAIVDALNVRASPGINGTKRGQLKFYELVNVIGGPTCADGYVWWEIRSAESRITGWAAEVGPTEWLMVPEPWLGCQQ